MKLKQSIYKRPNRLKNFVFNLFTWCVPASARNGMVTYCLHESF